MTFSNKDIEDYYNQTEIHYRKHWKLNVAQALHYGLWNKGTKNFSEALLNSNKRIIKLGKINSSQNILDAGCGIGGTANYISKKTKSKITGISLNQSQLDFATQFSQKESLNTQFIYSDFCKTPFNNNEFDTVYAIESMCHARNEKEFLQEVYRILKPKGKLIILDYFKPQKLDYKSQKLLEKWLHKWAIDDIDVNKDFIEKSKEVGFYEIVNKNINQEIIKSSKRMYRSSFLGAIPSILYNVTHPKVTRFAKTHFKSGYWQYINLKKGNWAYYQLVLEK